jgi:hypothetical protein
LTPQQKRECGSLCSVEQPDVRYNDHNSFSCSFSSDRFSSSSFLSRGNYVIDHKMEYYCSKLDGDYISSLQLKHSQLIDQLEAENLALKRKISSEDNKEKIDTKKIISQQKQIQILKAEIAQVLKIVEQKK